ncbi:Spy/CpxP family protein refolding chaperone [Ferrimonas senticii]|uniref:Spy/CpxP family protein refolding chaperone n=1 Tax=Ferrimonas senticii TaxID=394566 RepID=UPI0003FA4C09|nr:Spy/CpxP family protein refolding chaperone [Ferrimonas senticii]
MKRATKFSLIGLALVMASGTALAGMMGGHHGGKGFHDKHGGQQIQRMYRHMMQLDLSTEQQAQLQQLISEAKAQHQQLREQRRSDQQQRRADNQAQMQALMDAPVFDEVVARELLSAKQQQRTDMAVKQMKLRHQMLQVLTDEQKAQLQAEREQRQQQRQERRGNR